MAFTGYGLLHYLHVGFNRSCSFLQKVTYFLFWPFYILFIKAASIFVAGQDDWKSANMRLTGFEGLFEAQAQFMLQLYIAFARSDRMISNLQILTLASSLMSIVSAKIESHFAEKPQATMKTKASYLPLYLAFSFFNMVSMALMIATLRCYSFVIVIIINIVVSLKRCLSSRLKTKSGRFFDSTTRFILQALSLIAVAILVNSFSSSVQILTFTSLEGLKNVPISFIYLSDIDIVKNLCYFNTIFVLCLSSFAIYLPLQYFQVVVPKMEREEAKKTMQERENDANKNENESIV